MKYQVIIISVLGWIALFGFGFAAVAADYWPVVDRATWTYQQYVSSTYSVSMHVYDGGFSLHTPAPYDLGVGSYSYFRWNDDGDVEAVSWMSGVNHSFLSASFDPPLLFLDLPLEIGKVWESVNETGGLRGEVLREEEVTVPAGVFNVLVVKISNILNGGLFAGTYYLDRNLGTIVHRGNSLVTISGIVATEVQSWGSVKALYR